MSNKRKYEDEEIGQKRAKIQDFFPSDLIDLILNYTQSCYQTIIYDCNALEKLIENRWIPMTIRAGESVWMSSQIGCEALSYRNFLYVGITNKRDLFRFDIKTSETKILKNVFRPKLRDYTLLVMDSNRHQIVRLDFAVKKYSIVDLNTFIETQHEYKDNKVLECKSNSYSATMHQGNKIYIFEQQKFTILDLETHALTRTDEKSNFQFFNPGLVSSGNKIYVMGGRSWATTSTGCHKHVEMFDTETNSWEICTWKLPVSGSYCTYLCKSEEKLFLSKNGVGDDGTTGFSRYWVMNMNDMGKWASLPNSHYFQSHIVSLQVQD
jgi:hypothetical protein